MWVFLTSRIRTWLILAVVLPAIGLILRTVRRRLEARSGQTPVVRTLTRLERLTSRKKREEQAQAR